MRPALTAASKGWISIAVGMFSPSRRATCLPRRSLGEGGKVAPTGRSLRAFRRGCHEQRGTLRSRIDRQRDDSSISETRGAEQALQLTLAEAQPDMSHL